MNHATDVVEWGIEGGKDATSRGHKAPPRVVTALRSVGESQASASQKALLRAMLQWWNPTTGELWPSIATLAASTGYSPRGVQKIMRGLQHLGVVELVVPSLGGRSAKGKGYTNRYVLCLENLRRPVEAPKPIAARARNPEPRRAQPRTAMTTNPERRADEPSIRNIPVELPMEHRNEVAPSVGGCVDGEQQTLRAVLIRCGVRGANLETLASAAGLTVQAVEAELRDIQRDAAARNPAAILVARLSQRTGKTLKSRPPLEQSTLNIVAKLEQMRRQYRNAAESNSPRRPQLGD